MDRQKLPLVVVTCLAGAIVLLLVYKGPQLLLEAVALRAGPEDQMLLRSIGEAGADGAGDPWRVFFDADLDGQMILTQMKPGGQASKNPVSIVRIRAMRSPCVNRDHRPRSPSGIQESSSAV